MKKAISVTLMIVAVGTVLSAPASILARQSSEIAKSQAALLQTTVTLDAVADATVRSWAPDTNFGDEAYLELSYESIEFTEDEAVTLLRFDVSTIPSDAVIDAASLHLFLDSASGANPVSISVFEITSSWNETTVTWNTPLYTGVWGVNASVDASSGSYKSWSITSLAQSWVDNPSSNHGLMLRGPTDGTLYERWFESRDNMEMVPKLEVTYHMPPYTFSGRVYAGEPEDTSTPMEGVSVELWGDEDEWPEAGFERVLLDSSSTDASGAFTVEWGIESDWTYLHVIELDPPDAISTGAVVDEPGYVRNFNVVSYIYEQLRETGEHAFGGVAFWDLLPGGLPDLIVTDVWPDAAAICARVENVGGAEAPAGHEAALLIDGIQQASALVDVDLAPAEAWEGCFDYAWECTGESDSVEVRADATDAVGEESETNNVGEVIWECDTTPPSIIAGPTVSGLASTSATISWQTDEPADSSVPHDTVAGLLRHERTNPAITTEHSVTLEELTPSTTYRFVVRSTDPAGNGVESKEGTFETLASQDDENPTAHIIDPGTVTGTVTLRAQADDNQGVEKVEFHLDDALVFTDYSPPYEWEFVSDEEENGNHTLKAQVVDLSGRLTIDQLPFSVVNFIDVDAPNVRIFNPYEGADVYGDTPVWVTVSDDSGWSEVEWFVDGKKMGGGQFPVSPSLDIRFWWDTTFFAPGSHSLAVQATDGDGKIGTDLMVVNVANAGPAARPKLVVTKHEMFRHANTFAVELTVENKGQATASGIEIVDPLVAFQPISRTFNGVAYETSLNASTMQADTIIKDPAGLAKGASRKYFITALPVLVHDKPPGPSVGKAVKLSYGGPLGAKYQEDVKFEVLKTTATAGSAPSEAVVKAHANAVKEADYLIVTNPSRLVSHNASQDTDPVLSDMARLAFMRKGVLGYLRTSDRNTLRNLVRTNGDWGKRLHADFRAATKGYLLIVGETEIVPSWLETRWSLTWSNSTCTTSQVGLSDLPYADTGGSNAAPELVVGRIIGNDAADLSAAIRASVEGSFDRSHALLISGTDGKSSIQKLFTGSVDEVEKEIKSEFSVTKLHWKDISTSQRVAQVRSNTAGKDVVLYQGHGAPDAWGDLETSDVLGDQTTAPPTPAISFGSTNPVVFGWACLSGSYEDHIRNSPCDYDGGDSNLAEAFFDRGAAVYIGATEVSPINDNRAAAKAFFASWWKPNTTVGKALTDLKRNRWSASGYTQLFIYEYNLYGDPKYGAAPKGNASAQLTAQREGLAEEPAASIDVVVPDYEVTVNDGLHEVEIPGGDLLLEMGDYRIPHYRTVLEYPPGYEIQDVLLTDLSGMVTDTGLTLPINERVTTSSGESKVRALRAAGNWVPQKEFDWHITEDPDGTVSLVIVMYAFKYDPATTDVVFYKNYSFDIAYNVSPVTLTEMETEDEYVQGATVEAEVWLENSGIAQDVSVSAVIKEYPTGEPAAGLRLETLEGLTGAASFAPRWDTSGFEPGAYYIEVTLKDTGGQILDRGTQLFDLGVSSGELTEFTVTPVHFEIGETINASLVFENKGSVDLSGSVVIEVRGESGAVLQEFDQRFIGLAPGQADTLQAAWDTTGAADGRYTIVGYALYDGGSTEPAVATVSTDEPMEPIYLPLVLLSQR